jgi:riboflavin kinase/FMN adenylyltransferase
MTFDRHPSSLIRPERTPKFLTRNSTKLALLEQMGVPAVLLLKFDEVLASIPAEEFITRLASSASVLSMICVGSQWSFGKGGGGNISLLKTFGEKLGFSVAEIAPVKVGGKAISSTRIREAVAAGYFQEAAECLGRWDMLCGEVVSGAGLGAKIGFPTANLSVAGMQLPPDGVYAVRVSQRTMKFTGVANIGVRPTVDPTGAERTVEVHLFDIDKNLVGTELCLEFVRYLRGEQRFPDLDALTAQIAKDCERAMEILQK